MIIRHVSIRNFRGIRSLDWPIMDRFVVLVGPGDSCKTTVFEAIDLALGRQWYGPTDADFYNGDPQHPISIEVTVGELPDKFFDFHSYGTCLRGWKGGVLHDEPQPGDEEVITVRFGIDKALDPSWVLVSNHDPDGVPFRARDRPKLGLHRLGTNVDHQLGWARGSLLTRASESADDLHGVFADVSRRIRSETKTDGIPGIQDVLARTQRIADEVGVGIGGLRAAINAADLSLGNSLLSLHQNDTPVRQFGLGSRRLLAIGLEMDAVVHGGIGLIDEVEHGLEPYRIHTLLARMRKAAEDRHGQMFLTTHAAEVIRDCPVSALHVVRAESGAVTIKQIPTNDDMQRMARLTPEALLARRVIVCEGKTEYGMCRGLDVAWTNDRRKSFAAVGCVPVNGSGNSKAAAISRDLHSLGYVVCFFGDSDQPPTPSWAELASLGIKVVRWKDQWAIEDAVFTTLSWSDVIQLLSKIPEASEPTFFKTIAVNRNRADVQDWGAPLESWTDTPKVRAALIVMSRKPPKKDSGKSGATNANDDGVWLKDIDMGIAIGHMLASSLPTLASDDDVRVKIEHLRAWIDAP